ncbi:DoxX family protein [Agrobacterium sp. rho-13.3]|uniref:DoxX family protein n=1 Tax=Agrobacterium sp. rho-13.3 TaxID=3072980 RepID=UPI002A0EFD0E|nr:DoxX family protein [Agrobacterium sp. rho-13.3]MDX8311914.1 DoxX family protein [Agrobacterium sp. rho-13.3]
MSFAAVAKSKFFRGLKILLSLLALGAGVAELWGPSVFVAEFELIGFGQWFRYFTGVTLIVGSMLLFWEKTAGLGAALLCAVCIGAFFAHFFVLHGDLIHTVIPALILGAIAWRHRDQMYALL